MESLSLFDDEPPAFSPKSAAAQPTATVAGKPPVRPAAKQAEQAEQVEQAGALPQELLALVDSEPLPAQVDALRRIPEKLRDTVTELALRLFKAKLLQLSQAIAGQPGAESDPSRKPTMLAHSAKLHALSCVSHMAAQPWHLADAKVLTALHAQLRKTGDLSIARKHLVTDACLNLFVVALPEDDRMSYLKAAAAARRRHPVHNLVLDGELIEWIPEADFLEACEIVGMPPTFIGIVDKAEAGRHSMLNPASTRSTTLCVDTNGHPWTLRPDGSVAPQHVQEPEAPAPASPVAPPNSAIQDKLRALRDRQTRARRSTP